jgi:O-methyltransferase
VRAQRVYELVTLPVLVVSLFHNRRIDPAYGMTWRRKFRLVWRMYRNSLRVTAATSYKAHVAMAVKLLEVPPSTKGVVVECGCFLGGSSTNLSLVCDIVGRDLILYDSFEGLPPPEQGEKYARRGMGTGAFKGSLETVQANIARGGALDRCVFRKGWLKDTLPQHTEPVVMCFLDVDYQASLHECVQHLWPKLVRHGFVFIDEFALVDYCALFFSERYWRQYFDTTPPGLFGAGTGVGLGHYYMGPFLEAPPLQSCSSVAYTWKGSNGFWDYYPEDIAAGILPERQRRRPQGKPARDGS